MWRQPPVSRCRLYTSQSAVPSRLSRITCQQPDLFWSWSKCYWSYITSETVTSISRHFFLLSAAPFRLPQWIWVLHLVLFDTLSSLTFTLSSLSIISINLHLGPPLPRLPDDSISSILPQHVHIPSLSSPSICLLYQSSLSLNLPSLSIFPLYQSSLSISCNFTAVLFRGAPLQGNVRVTLDTLGMLVMRPQHCQLVMSPPAAC